MFALGRDHWFAKRSVATWGCLKWYRTEVWKFTAQFTWEIKKCLFYFICFYHELFGSYFRTSHILALQTNNKLFGEHWPDMASNFKILSYKSEAETEIQEEDTHEISLLSSPKLFDAWIFHGICGAAFLPVINHKWLYILDCAASSTCPSICHPKMCSPGDGRLGASVLRLKLVLQLHRQQQAKK